MTEIMRGEAEGAEMVWTYMYEGGIGVHVHMERCWGWNCQVGEREGSRGEDIWMFIVREDRGCWMAGGSGEV